METQIIEVDIFVIGGGTAGPIAAIKAKQKSPKSKVLLLDKANVKRSGAIAEGMDSYGAHLHFSDIHDRDIYPLAYVRELAKFVLADVAMEAV